jgi:hypothetical protein
MSLGVYSQFRYGHTVGNENLNLDLVEGVTPKVAAVEIGSYSLTDLLQAVALALNDVLTVDASLSVDYETGIVTIDFSGPVDVLGLSGENAATSILGLLGIDAIDYLNVTQIVGIERSGFIFEPQFFLQDYMSTEQNNRAASATVSKSASGRVSVQSFGDERFMKCSLLFITNLIQPPDSLIKNNPTGYEDAIAFFEYLKTKAPIEFCEDLTKPDEFEQLILESTPTSPDGVGFELIETFARGLPFFYEIKSLVFRSVEGD